MKVLTIIYVLLFIGIGAKAEEVSFKQDVRPVFKRYCAGCHFGSLNYSAAYQNRIKILNKFVRSRQMPPKYISDRPSRVEVELVRRWIESGAKK
jgi:hypothetical protein